MTEQPVAFKNGADIHFDYKGESPQVAASKKKKKRKSKSKKSVDVTQAHLANPDEDYPTSRVIKQAPNGDVIVESLNEDPPKHHDHRDHLHSSIWDSASLEEQENLKLFWESLGESQKMELVKIDKKSIMEIFKNETKASINNAHHNHANGSTSTGNSNGTLFNNNCTCSYCGRRSNIIEDELENIYDNHFDDIIDFIHEVRDINDLNALPGLLFGGFHMLEEEHKLQKRQHRLKHRSESETERVQKPTTPAPSAPIGGHREQRSLMSEESKHKINKINEINDNLNFTNTEKLEEIQLKKALDEDFNAHIAPPLPSKQAGTDTTDEQKIFNKLLDPKLVEALENLDFEKMRLDVNASMINNDYINQANLLQKAGSLKEIIRDLHKADKAQLEKGMSFLQNMGNIFSSSANTLNNDPNIPSNVLTTKFNDQLTQGLSSFAEDLLKNDGHSFVDMMESLSESRTAREDILKESKSKIDAPAAWVDEDDSKPSLSQPAIDAERDYEEYEDKLNSKFEYEEDEGIEDNEEEEDEDDDGEEDEEEENEDELDDQDASDTESEISEEEKMQEIRRLFLIQVIKLFQERLKNAYKEKLSKDRTQMLIEELEAEENAKKERELKKLQQREKAKEKKRLQQLAKEEERKKKEEEQRIKEEEERQRAEALRAEQKRKKEEARLKKEEEKKKRIEELKRKEEEHRKKVEAQIQKEEEAKRVKEERRKRAEEERKKREEEKKQKEILKKQREEEKRLRLEKEQKERLKQEQDNQDRIAAEISQKAAFVAVEDDENVPISPTKSPSKNHILEQLYQARPGSISNASNTQLSNPDPFLPGGVSPNPANIIPNPQPFQSVSPSTHNSLLYGTQTGSMSPWSSKSRLNSVSNVPASQPNLFQSQLSNNFSPFNGFSGETQLGTEPFNSNPAPGTNSVWSQSRNNSIWSTTPSGNIWGNNVNMPNANIPNPVAKPVNLVADSLIQTAAFNAFQLLQNSNQLEFGVVPLLKLYQSTKTVMNNNALTVNQFLGACRSNSSYLFDLIYDDFGTVTHVKVSESTLAPQYPAYAPINPNQNVQFVAPSAGVAAIPATANGNFRTSPPPGLGSSAGREEPFGFNGFGDTSANGGRGLWN
ncbi:uncharacterized protein CANTADRAFT_89717 [Suhomyces tanzawaensis NRRL Y-17324]|uniref:Stress response protein NST1 n=1 Tax=Suhomyces tanzawaensis NRRL Y-17324 TaxID=984487 RepID=A0A1E4SKV7_9ASCO|nr:uncharacterized protein CANTADRAFT_89717 [Suhomyces tanzawaensis NRRL Y-17324]ODV80133.1 hypothetical protein CANTADRAFT_89717 [Suhomyces tanzawaensis NRRL Y-17324]